jgi:hypothetical protein
VQAELAMASITVVQIANLLLVQAELAMASITVVQIANLLLIVSPNSFFLCGEAMLIGIMDCGTR